MRSVADLVPSRGTLPPHRIAQLRDELFAVLSRELADARLRESARLHTLSAAVLPLAQIFLRTGMHRDTVIEHAAEVLEAMFLDAALCETPSLAVLFRE